MNNTILLGLLCMISLYGCKEDSILRYDETLDSVYFEGTTPGEQTSVQEINFAERIVRNDDIVLAGDSVNTLTIKLVLRVMGWEADHDRKVSLNVRPAVPEDSRTLANHEISGPAKSAHETSGHHSPRTTARHTRGDRGTAFTATSLLRIRH